jgi:hypothetical protein
MLYMVFLFVCGGVGVRMQIAYVLHMLQLTSMLKLQYWSHLYYWNAEYIPYMLAK